MKTITIGRGPENMVTLDDPKISRHHALLRCYPWGKMEIVDISQNGTFVNGMQIASNRPYPLTRKDVVSFAHAEKLDWKRVPAPYRRIKHILLLIIAFIALIIWGAYIFSKHNPHMSLKDAPPPPCVLSNGRTPVDSIVDSIKSEKKSDDRFVFPQPKKTNTKEKKKAANKDTSKTQTQEKDEVSMPEEVPEQEQSVLL